MTHPVTLQARDDKARQAATLGIDEEFISLLVEEFYRRVRSDEMLGPIFSRHVTDWPPHLAKMKLFWQSIAIEAGRFKGNPMVKHLAIDDLDGAHFGHWLRLFHRTLDDIAPSTGAAAFFREKSEMIGASLLAGIEAHQMRQRVQKQ